jgi:predicted ATPase
VTVTAFVGRGDVVGQLDRTLADAAAGGGHVALIYGEAGIGKTRLCQQLWTPPAC